MSVSDKLAEFLQEVNPSFTKYVETFTENGLESVEDISTMADDDFKNLGIPLVPWRKILSAARSQFASTEGQKQNSPTAGSPNSSSNNLKALSWGVEEVALFVRTLGNGECYKYGDIFASKNVDGPKLLALEAAKQLLPLVPELDIRYKIFEGVLELKNNNVPALSQLVQKQKQIEGNLSSEQKHNLDNTNTADSTIQWASMKSNTDAAPKSSKQNMFVKRKEETGVRTRLLKFYEIYNPEKLENEEAIEELLKRYQGRENQLFADLEKKYILGGPKSVYKRKEIAKKPEDKSLHIMKTLWKLYSTYVRSVEESFKFPEFHTPLLDEVDFLARPMVLLVGQYSVGKTSFIRYLVGRDFPGIRVGPEPTTDAFGAIMWGKEERLVPGHTVPMDRSKPFRSLQNFGAGFLNKFGCAEVPAPILESISFIDTPGILSGQKQRLGRNYDFAKVVEWFAYRSDRILLLFDAHKLDISDEFKSSIEMLKGHDDKIRCVLNKADAVSNQQLLRVYGALMWSLGKVFKTPEVLRVFVGSFWDEDYKNDHNAELFDAESMDLISDLRGLPRHAATRKINEFVKRTRQMKVHALIVEHLRKQFGWFGNKTKQQQKLLNNLRSEFKNIAKEQKLNLNDFPNPDKFKGLIQKHDISKFPKFKQKWIDGFDHVLDDEIPRLMQTLPSSSDNQDGVNKENGGNANPFAEASAIGDAQGDISKKWAISGILKNKYDAKFYSLSLQAGKASGNQIMSLMLQSGLSRDVLKSIWDLSDIDQDGKMDDVEFALCMYLIDTVQNGVKLPPTLPIALVPPTKRHLVEFE